MVLDKNFWRASNKNEDSNKKIPAPTPINGAVKMNPAATSSSSSPPIAYSQEEVPNTGNILKGPTAAGHSSPSSTADNIKEERPCGDGNINIGPGAGAQNMGPKAASITHNSGEINFKFIGDRVRAPIEGNLNIGPGAGGFNSGCEAAGISNNQGTVNFYY